MATNEEILNQLKSQLESQLIIDKDNEIAQLKIDIQEMVSFMGKFLGSNAPGNGGELFTKLNFFKDKYGEKIQAIVSKYEI
jgi:hypothetical protein